MTLEFTLDEPHSVSSAPQVDMDGSTLLAILLLVTFAYPASSYRGWRSERAIEGLYLNKTDGCDGYVSRSQRRVCSNIENLPKVLQFATSGAVAFCKKIFEYEHWPCQIDKNIFTKVGRERAFLTSLLAWSVSQAAALFCAKGELFGCQKWETPLCSGVITRGTNIAKRYFLSGEFGMDIIGRMVKHNIINGIQESRKTECISSESFYLYKKNWASWSPALSNDKIAEIFISKYHSAYKWETNSAHFIEIHNKKKRLVYLEDPEESCDITRGRRCRDLDNCSYLCCGRGFIKRKLTPRRLIDCNCLFKPFVLCEKCLELIYICR